MRQKILAVVLLLAVAAGLGWYVLWDTAQADLVLYGNVEIRQVDVAFRVEGRIAGVLVDEGDRVRAGQELAKLDTDLLRQQRDQAAAQLAGQKAQLQRLERGYRVEEVEQARAAVARARAVADNAAIHLRRVSAMRAQNAVSQKELDNARSSDRSARADLRATQEQLDMLLSGYREEEVLAQRAAVEAAAAALELAEIRLRDAVLVAPQDGVVLTRAREAGSIVQAGQTVYSLSLVDPVWLRVYVDEPQLGRVKPGMAVRVRVDAFPDREFSGRVGFISPAAEFTPKSVETLEVRTSLVYRLRVQVDDPDDVMRQGMPVTVRLVERP